MIHVWIEPQKLWPVRGARRHRRWDDRGRSDEALRPRPRLVVAAAREVATDRTAFSARVRPPVRPGRIGFRRHRTDGPGHPLACRRGTSLVICSHHRRIERDRLGLRPPTRRRGRRRRTGGPPVGPSPGSGRRHPRDDRPNRSGCPRDSAPGRSDRPGRPGPGHGPPHRRCSSDRPTGQLCGSRRQRPLRRRRRRAVSATRLAQRRRAGRPHPRRRPTDEAPGKGLGAERVIARRPHPGPELRRLLGLQGVRDQLQRVVARRAPRQRNRCHRRVPRCHQDRVR